MAFRRLELYLQLENKNFVLVLASVNQGARIGERSAAVMILTPTSGHRYGYNLLYVGEKLMLPADGDVVIGDTAEAMLWGEAWEAQFQMFVLISWPLCKD